MPRIITFNIACQPLTQELLQFFKSVSADIILLQEIEEYEKGYTKKTAKKFGYNSVYTPARELRSSGTHGLAILSHGKIHNVKVQTLPLKNLRPKPRNRIAVHSDVIIDSNTIQVCNVHLDTRLNPEERAHQLSPVLKEIKSPAILAGDFNTAPIKFYKNLMPIGLSNQKDHIDSSLEEQGFETSNSSAGRSFRLLPWQLDAIYPLNYKITGYGVYKDVKLSDHFPVWADIEELENLNNF